MTGTPSYAGWTPLSVEELQTVLPAYEVLAILGRGGMGAVYKARQRSLKRFVAIKVLPLGTTDEGFRLVERFRKEAETLAQMNHPAIVDVYDFGETADGLLYFVMEFVDGTDVHQMIYAKGKLDPEEALAITAHVCDALGYAHRQGVVHRDIKPANILINREGHVKVADFGLAKMHDPTLTGGLTLSNVAMGTPDYAAPELFKTGPAGVDHRADLYAVGVMLYQMLTGEVPRGFFKLPSERGADPRFDAIIVKAMETNRDERYQSAIEVRHALDQILTTPLARDEGTGAISPSAIPQRSRVMPKTPLPSPGKAKWVIAAVVTAMLAGAAFFALKKRAVSPAHVPSQMDAGDAAPLADVAAAPAQKQEASSTPNARWTDHLATANRAVPWQMNKGVLSTSDPMTTQPLGQFSDGEPVQPPNTSTWRDVTGVLRENVRTKAGFTISPDGVQRSNEAGSGDTQVMASSTGHRAVRVRYINQVQVSLWFKGGAGSAYVLAQQDRVMFKRQYQKGSEAVSMRPSVMHPAGFDPTQPHELTVAVQGATVRAWIDGRYVGEGQDDALKECAIAIVPMKSSAVQKVEAAELGANVEAASGGWQPIFMKPEDFGGDLRGVEFRDGATFIKGRTFRAPDLSGGGAIRATLQFCGSERTGSLTLRSTESAVFGEEAFACTAYLFSNGAGVVMQVRDRTAGINDLRRNEFTLSPALKLGESFTFELRAEAGKIALIVNGREVGAVKDTWKTGPRRLGITPSNSEFTEFRDVAVRSLSQDE